MADDEEIVLLREANPSGVVHVEIDRADVLKLDAQGSVRLNLAVSATAEEQEASAGGARPSRTDPSKNTWRIDYLHVSADGIAE